MPGNGTMNAAARRRGSSPTALSRQIGEQSASGVRTRWTFLSNHAHVLTLIARNPQILLREVAGLVGITERAVQRIVADLEEEGCLERERIGRRNRYRILPDGPLRHPVEAHCTVADLLDLLVGEPAATES